MIFNKRILCVHKKIADNDFIENANIKMELLITLENVNIVFLHIGVSAKCTRV